MSMARNRLFFSIRAFALQHIRRQSLYSGTSQFPFHGESRFHIVDLRSDTVTKPTARMRQAMAEAAVGDDVYREDPTVNALETEMAALFGKEDAIFVPSGTMGNLCSLLSHCFGRSEEIILGDKSHIFCYEQGAYSQFGGIVSHLLPNQPDGSIRLDQIESARRRDRLHQPTSRLLCLENTHNLSGGRVLPLDYMRQAYEMSHKLGLQVHLDGARLMNATVALQCSPREMTQFCDSISMCFSKGLGAPAGAIVAGDKDFIDRARRMRKALGGGMRQVGILAAAAFVAMENYETKIAADHTNARRIAEAVQALRSPFVYADYPETNFVMLKLCGVPANEVLDQLNTVTPSEEEHHGRGIIVRGFSWANGTQIRLVTHCNISDEDTTWAIKKIAWVAHHLTQRKPASSKMAAV